MPGDSQHRGTHRDLPLTSSILPPRAPSCQAPDEFRHGRNGTGPCIESLILPASQARNIPQIFLSSPLTLHVLSHQVQRNNSRAGAIRTSVTFRQRPPTISFDNISSPVVERSLNGTHNMIRQAQRTSAGRSQAWAIIYPPREPILCPKPKR